jgi:dihydrofolate reductase
MRRIIAALQVSTDGLIEGPHGELDWIQSWEDPFDLLPQIDTCILGRAMYPGYARYWGAILADPGGVLPFTGRPATRGEIDYAHFADRTPHVVLSRTLESADWHNTRIVRDLDAIRALKRRPGKDMHAVGGAGLVSSLLNAGLVDELRLVVQPVVLGSGKALFRDVVERHPLTLRVAEPLSSGTMRLTYDL